MFAKEIYVNRRKRLAELLPNGIVLLLGNVDSPMNYPANTFRFRQDSSFLYFFGLDFPGLAAVIDLDSGREVIFGNDVDMEDIIWMGPQSSMQEKAAQVGIDHTLPFAKIFEFVKEALKKGRKVHFLPPYRAENKILLQQLLGIEAPRQADYVSTELIKAVVSLRSVKEACEIAEIEKACATGYEMHTTAMQMARPGVWEQTIAGRLEGIATSGGGMLSFPVILSQNGETLMS